MREPLLSWSASHGWRKHVIMSAPASSTSVISTKGRWGLGRLSFTSCTMPCTVHDWPICAVAVLSRTERSI